MMKEDPDREPIVFKVETGLTLSDDDEGYTGPCRKGSGQICSAFPIKQNPNFLQNLEDGFIMAMKSESHDGLITRIKVENTRNEDADTDLPSTSFGVNSGFHVDGVHVKLEDSSTEGPHHESARHIPNVSSNWNPFVVLERIDLNLVDAFNSRTKSTLSHDVPSLTTQLNVENAENVAPLADPFHESTHHVPSAFSSLWNPTILLERIDLNLVNAFNLGTKSTLSHDFPSSMTQVKVEKTEDEVPSAGPSVDGRLHLFPEKKSSAFGKCFRFSLEGVGVKQKNRPLKGNLVQKKGASKFDFAKGGNKIALKAHPASFSNVKTFKLTDYSETVTRGVVNDLDNDSNYEIGYQGTRPTPNPAFLSSEECPGPSKNESDAQAKCGLTQVNEKKSSFLKNSSKLMSEKMLQGSKKLVSCCVCVKQVLLISLRAHLRSHSDERPFSCEQCPARFKSKGDLNQHLRIHSELKPYSCNQCSALFRTKVNLKRHSLSHSDEKPFSCEQCRACFKTKKALASHLKRHSDERPYSCEQCSARFKAKRNLNRHSAVHSEERPFNCDQCSGRFKSKKDLKQHLRVHSSERPFTCSLCQSRFKSEKELKQHLFSHSNERPFSCVQCLKRFKAHRTLTDHLRTHSDERPFSCGQCPLRFKSKGEIKGHLLSHSDWKPWLCERCSARFKSKANLSTHLLTHSDVRPFSCEQCSVSLKTKSHLKQHLLVHSDKKPFSCKDCPARFKSKGEIKLHSLRHSDERPYSCKQCTAHFKTKGDLGGHLKIHSDEKPFSCEQCPACFKTKREVKQHIRFKSKGRLTGHLLTRVARVRENREKSGNFKKRGKVREFC